MANSTASAAAAAVASSSSASLMMRVEISLACRDLVSLDLLSRSDPFIVLYERLSVRQRPPAPTHIGQTRGQQPPPSSPLNTPKEWREIGRTEVIKNDNNPTFRKHFVLDYRFEEIQELEFHILDWDGPTSFDTIGVVRCCMSNIVRPGSGPFQRDIVSADSLGATSSSFGASARTLLGGVAKSRGKMLLSCEQQVETPYTFTFVPEGRALEKMDFLGKSDPYLQILRGDVSGDLTVVHQTEMIRQSIDPKWARVTIPVTTLCNGDFDRTLVFRCYDWDSPTKSELIGEFRATLGELSGMRPPNVTPKSVVGSGSSKQFTLVRPLSKKNPTKPRGSIVLNDLRLIQSYSFLDFVRGGMQIGVMMAVDFTGSNGDPRLPTSLHYLASPGGSPYERVIGAIGNVVAPYDSDQMFPMWGFGAKVNGKLEHCFMMSQQRAVYGVDGMIDAYRQIVQRVELYGPTQFSPLLKAAIATVKAQPQSATQQNYTILVIITDGIIDDQEETIDAIIAASVLPMSIIIVGVGNADFEGMKALDSDDGLLRRNGKVAARDIVQFVPFNQFAASPPLLAAETLAEIPRQVVEWARQAGVQPLPPPPSYAFEPVSVP